jgi:tetratricopeptide (TPR) repeat protein
VSLRQEGLLRKSALNLGSIYIELGRGVEALPVLKRSLERSHPTDSIVRKLYALIIHCHRQFGELEEAKDACAPGRLLYPEDMELLFLEGRLRRDQGDAVGAEACFLRVLATQERSHFASVDIGLRGYKTRHNLATFFQDQGRLAEAEAQWQACLAEQPGFLPARLGLAELYLAQGRTDAFDPELARLENACMTVEAAVLRARAHLASRSFAAARKLLDETIARAPQAIWPRVILSHVLLQEGSDPAAAEQALRDVLALDPNQREARHNLGVLLQQQGRTLEPALQGKESSAGESA